jgi:hypothetical protein
MAQKAPSPSMRLIEDNLGDAPEHRFFDGPSRDCRDAVVGRFGATHDAMAADGVTFLLNQARGA